MTFSDGRRSMVRRVDGTVVRSGPGERSQVHHLLRLLEDADWPGAPRLIDPGPPEVLSFLPGIVPARDAVPGWVTRPAAIVALARLIRAFHDLTAGHGGAAAVWCHNDLSPSNTVHDEATRLPIAFLDWDLAAPGDRTADLGHAAWQWFRLGPSADVSAARDGIATLVTAYDPTLSAGEVVDQAVQWQRRTADGIEAGAPDDPTLAALLADGVPDDCRVSARWTAEHRAELIVGGS